MKLRNTVDYSFMFNGMFSRIRDCHMIAVAGNSKP